jgi:hypothetical protein
MTTNIRMNFINNKPPNTNEDMTFLPPANKLLFMDDLNKLELINSTNILNIDKNTLELIKPFSPNDIIFIKDILIKNNIITQTSLNNEINATSLNNLYFVLYNINNDPNIMSITDLQNRINSLNTLLNMIINIIQIKDKTSFLYKQISLNQGTIFFIYYTLGLYLNEANNVLNSKSNIFYSIYNSISQNNLIYIPILFIFILLILIFLYKLIKK